MKSKMRIMPILLVLFSLTGACVPLEQASEATLPPTESVVTISAETVDQLISVQTLTFDEAVILRWTSDGSAFWVQGVRTAALYDSRSLQEIASYDVSEYGILYDVSPDGRLIAYALEEPDIILYDVITQQETGHIPVDTYVQNVAFSPDGTVLGASSMDEWKVSLWDTKTQQEIKTLTGFETAAPVYSFQYGADGKTILWISRGTVQPQDIESETLVPKINHEDFISCVALSPDGKYLASAAAGTVEGEFKPIVTIWDAHTGESLAVFSDADYFSALAFSPDGSLLAAGGKNKVFFWDIVDFRSAGEISTDGECVNSLQFSPDGIFLLISGTNGSLRILHTIGHE